MVVGVNIGNPLLWVAAVIGLMVLILAVLAAAAALAAAGLWQGSIWLYDRARLRYRYRGDHRGELIG
jgi:hypothetical protein